MLRHVYRAGTFLALLSVMRNKGDNKMIKKAIIASIIFGLIAGVASAAITGKAKINGISYINSEPELISNVPLKSSQPVVLKANPPVVRKVSQPTTFRAVQSRPTQSFTLPSFSLAPQKNSFGDVAFTASMVSFAALNVADFLSTKKALSLPGLAEGNPLMKNIVKNDLIFAGVKVGITAVTYLLTKNLYKKNKTLGWAISIAANFLMSVVVANNMRLIDQAQGRI